jgi:hypothetical protein
LSGAPEATEVRLPFVSFRFTYRFLADVFVAQRVP